MKNWKTALQKRLAESASQAPPPSPHPMNFSILSTLEDFQVYWALNAKAIAWRREEERAVGQNKQPFEGTCSICGKPVQFKSMDNIFVNLDGAAYPVLREDLICCACSFNSRLRATVHILEQLLDPDAQIYMTEQVTPLFKLMRERHRGNVMGSEYLGDVVPLGGSKDGIRNEDVTSLTFEDASFDAVCTCDVLEHVFDYRKAFLELARVLKSSGWLILSAPFLHHQDTEVRARLGEDGSIEHLMPPEYHADPLSSEGCLCVYHFGWDILLELKKAGFSWAGVVAYWSKEFGYMGLGEQIFIIARK